MTGYYSATKINNKNVDKDAKVKIWNANTKQFVDAKKMQSNIVGRYVQLIDTDADNSPIFGNTNLLSIIYIYLKFPTLPRKVDDLHWRASFF